MPARALPSREELFALLDTVKDPEVPVVSVVELGVVRDAEATDAGVTVKLTPTYSGCPAMREIEQGIVQALEAQGLGPVTVKTVYQPAWTTDWITSEAKRKLEAYGIAPPGPAARDDDLVPLLRRAEVVRCPYCTSGDTGLRSEFGSTSCKSIRFCNACHQPFEQFKAI
ncbi:MAG: 1,2-phenylacetyl-CoA epoxidase subunit PaaD [Gemmatimonadaceae bacterium]